METEHIVGWMNDAGDLITAHSKRYALEYGKEFPQHLNKQELSAYAYNIPVYAVYDDLVESEIHWRRGVEHLYVDDGTTKLKCFVPTTPVIDHSENLEALFSNVWQWSAILEEEPECLEALIELRDYVMELAKEKQ